MDYIAPGLDEKFDRKRLAKLNRKLEMAFQILLDESCPNCGVPVWLGHSTLSDIDFHVDVTTCYGCQADEEYKKIHKLDAGDSTSVRAYMATKGDPMVTRQNGIMTVPQSTDPYAKFDTTDDTEMADGE